MPTRLITPSQLSLFSISPVIGAWWQEQLEARKLFDGNKPAVSELDQQLFADGLRHERVLLNKLEREGHRIARLPGEQTEADYAATQAAVAGRILALCHAAQPSPGSQLRQGCDQKHRPSSLGSGAPGCTPGDAINQKGRLPMTGSLFVLSVLLFVAGISLISLG